MKKVLMLLCAIGLAAGLTACEDEAERDADRTTTTTESARSEEEMAEEEMAEEEMAEEEMAEGEEDIARAEEEVAQEEEEMAAGEMDEQRAMLEVAEQEPFGEYLANAQGMSLYMFEADTQGQESACYDACAEAWPPLTIEEAGELTVAEGISEEMLGTIERRDGAMQVTYNGWPLYTFVQDQSPGDTTGQDKEGFGGEWYLMAPSGEKIEEEGQASR